ncbi:MAG TPA: roadblock/LC7 domain-containing protein [Anaerolineae bacterium]|nr:roadblock/LC7 domain-containing protein [Anaerolineae bacterium]HQI84227.1 roadblock/LC7 domain-containing protein [Anaerolineae bacterium]
MKAIQQIVLELSRQEGFGTVVLTDATGLPLAISENREEAEALAAVVADILRSSSGISRRLEWGEMSEIMLLAHDAQRGVLCRRFRAGEQDLVLALFIQPQHVYWQATGQAIQKIQQTWRFSGAGK